MNINKRLFCLVIMFFGTLTLSTQSLSAGYWLYPVKYQHVKENKGSSHAHTYDGSTVVMTGDSGIIKGCQSIFVHSQIVSGKTEPDGKEVMNGKCYDVYEYANGCIFHAGREQATYIY